ncbi:MAG TPA: hypothetical protein DDY31_15155 [Lachnospiraceae bacterium]|nr:hypothetical protein [Lachnospiraceae bacterium]
MEEKAEVFVIDADNYQDINGEGTPFYTMNGSSYPEDVGRILRTFKIKKNVEVTDNGKIII